MNEFCDTQENIVLTDCLAQGKILYDSRIHMYWFSPPKKHFFRKRHNEVKNNWLLHFTAYIFDSTSS